MYIIINAVSFQNMSIIIASCQKNVKKAKAFFIFVVFIRIKISGLENLKYNMKKNVKKGVFYFRRYKNFSFLFELRKFRYLQ